MNFGILVRAEPKLLELLNEIMKEPKTLTDKQMNDLWYKNGYKHRMEYLVGLFCEDADPLLKTSAAYDCAYETLYGALTGEALR